jgi:hypothetical protein
MLLSAQCLLFPSAILFYSVDACPPQRTYVLTQCAPNFTLLPAHLRLYIYVAVNLTVGFNDRRGNSSRQLQQCRRDRLELVETERAWPQFCDNQVGGGESPMGGDRVWFF